MNLPLKCLVLSLQIAWTHLLSGELGENGFILSTARVPELCSLSARFISLQIQKRSSPFSASPYPTHSISYRVSPVGVPTAPPLSIRPHYRSSANTLPHFYFMPNLGLCVVDLSQDIRIAPAVSSSCQTRYRNQINRG